MRPVLLQPAFVLHRRPYRETSCLVELFTFDYGRLSVVMRGVRKPRSSVNGLLQPFVPLIVSWSGKSDLKTLSHIEANGSVRTLQGINLYAGFYLNELLMCLIQQWDAHPQLYLAYEAAMVKLYQSALLEEILRAFEKRLLEEIGYGLLPKRNIFLNQIKADQYYRFIPGEGLILTQVQKINTPVVAGDIFYGQHLLTIANEEWTDTHCLRDAKRLTRLILNSLLGEKAIHSRRLFLKFAKEETS